MEFKCPTDWAEDILQKYGVSLKHWCYCFPSASKKKKRKKKPWRS